MKRLCSTLAFLIIFLAANTNVAFAGSVLDLVGVSNGGGGPTFTFRVSGDFAQGDLGGTVQVEDGDSFRLHCKKIDLTTVVCHAAKKVSGQDVIVYFGGAKFWVRVPQPSLGQGNGNDEYCYTVYDIDYFEEVYVPLGWMPQGQYCQETEAAYADKIYFYSIPWQTEQVYYFWPNGVYVFDWDNPGTGYFWGPR